MLCANKTASFGKTLFVRDSLSIKFILIPITWVVYNIIRNVVVFHFISDDMVMVIGLKKMIISIVFWDFRLFFVQKIINF